MIIKYYVKFYDIRCKECGNALLKVKSSFKKVTTKNFSHSLSNLSGVIADKWLIDYSKYH